MRANPALVSERRCGSLLPSASYSRFNSWRTEVETDASLGGLVSPALGTTSYP